MRGLAETGSTTTRFGRVARNRVSRYHLVLDALDGARRVPRGAESLARHCHRRIEEHTQHVRDHLEDPREVSGWLLPPPPPRRSPIEDDLRLRRIASE